MINTFDRAEELPVAPAPTPVPADAVTHERLLLSGSPLAPKVQAWMTQCADPKLTEKQLAALAGEGRAMLVNAEGDPAAALLRDVLQLTDAFLISRQGSDAAMRQQGEWRGALSALEGAGGWRGMLAGWNSGKLDSQLAGQRPPDEQLVFLRQSLDGFLRAAAHGTQTLPLAMPVVGADVDASYLQTPEQRGTPMVTTLPSPRRLVSALAVTVAYAEQQAGNHPEVARLLAIADEQQTKGAEEFKDAPFLRLNLAISGHIADGAVRGKGKPDVLRVYIAELSDEPLVSPNKKTEWLAHAYALLALSTGDQTALDRTFKYLDALAAARPTFMTIIAIEPTFKELTKKFPATAVRMNDLLGA